MNEVSRKETGAPDLADSLPVGRQDDKLEPPAKRKVVLLNDNFTTKDFVVAVLMLIFHKSGDEAVRIMETVHREGKGFVGEYPYDIAATKCAQVRSAAKKQGFPLRCVIE